VSIIDLDHAVQATSSRAPRPHLRIVVTLTLGALFFGLAGEPRSSPSPSPDDKATFCPLIQLLDASSPDVVIIDPDTGKAARIVHCRT
jgi:hypothetical protein